jgi:hypothetical protein
MQRALERQDINDGTGISCLSYSLNAGHLG